MLLSTIQFVIACLTLACSVYAAKTARELRHLQRRSDVLAKMDLARRQIIAADIGQRACSQVHGKGQHSQASRY